MTHPEFCLKGRFLPTCILSLISPFLRETFHSRLRPLNFLWDTGASAIGGGSCSGTIPLFARVVGSMCCFCWDVGGLELSPFGCLWAWYHLRTGMYIIPTSTAIRPLGELPLTLTALKECIHTPIYTDYIDESEFSVWRRSQPFILDIKMLMCQRF